MWQTVRLGLRPWRSSVAAQILSIFSVALLASAICFFWNFSAALKPMESFIQNRQVVYLYLDAGLAEAKNEKGEELRQLVHQAVASDPSARVTWVGAQEVAEHLREKNPELAQEIESMGEDGKMLLPRYFRIEGEISKASLTKLQGLVDKQSGFDSLDTAEEVQRPYLSAVRTLGWFARGLALSLLVALVVIFAYLAQSHSNVLHESIEQFRLLGASALQSFSPLMVSVSLIGLTSGALAALVLRVSVSPVMARVGEIFPLLKDIRQGAFFWQGTWVFESLALSLGLGLVACLFALIVRIKRL